MTTEKKKPATLKENISHHKGEYQMFIVKILILVLAIAFWFLLYHVSSLVGVLFASFFLAILFTPFLKKMRRYKIPEWLGALIIYAIFLLFVLTVVFAIVPIFLEQIGALLEMISRAVSTLQEAYTTQGIWGLWLPSWMEGYLRDLLSQVDFPSLFSFLQRNFSTIGSILGENATTVATRGASVLASFTSTVFGIFLVFLFTFFIILERASIRQFFYDILPEGASGYLQSKEQRITEIFYYWIKWQVILGVAIFILTYLGLLGLKLFGIDLENTFTLALIAGLMEFIPYVGPFLALLPALAIALGVSFPAVVAVIILYIIIQQLENNVLVPMVMSRTLELSPLLVLFIMTLGASLAGVIGVIVAIPAAAIIQLFVRDGIAHKKRLTKKAKYI